MYICLLWGYVLDQFLPFWKLGSGPILKDVFVETKQQEYSSFFFSFFGGPKTLTKWKLGSGPRLVFWGDTKLVQNPTFTLVQNPTFKNGPFLIKICCFAFSKTSIKIVSAFRQNTLEKGKSANQKDTNVSHFENTCKKCYVVTPNLDQQFLKTNKEQETKKKN